MTPNQLFNRKPFTPTPLNRRTPVPSDIDIAQEATLKPITLIAEELGLAALRDRAVRRYQSQGAPGGTAAPAPRAGWQIYRCYRHYPHPVGRRQNHHHGGSQPGAWELT